MKRWRLLFLVLMLFGLSVTVSLAESPALNQKIYRGIWNPQGTLIAFDTNNFLWIYTAELQFVTQLDLRLPNSDLSNNTWTGRITWSPDGSKLSATVVFEGEVDNIGAIYRYGFIWDTRTWEQTVLTDYLDTMTPVVFSPDSRMAAGIEIYDYGSNLKFYNADDGRPAELPLSKRSIGGHDLAWSAIDAATLITAGIDIYIWDINQAERRGTISDFNGDQGFQLNPLNDNLAFVNADWNVEIWSINPIQQLKVIDAPDMIFGFQWAGRDITFDTYRSDEHNADGGEINYWRWNIMTGEKVFLMQRTYHVDPLPMWNPDGSAYVLSDKQGIYLYDTATGALKCELLFTA